MLVKALGTASSPGQTTRAISLLIDQTTLIDCGPEVSCLSPTELVQISNVLLSHGELSRCHFLPSLAHSHATHRGPGFTIYALQDTLDHLRQHLFNGDASPDYTKALT